MLRTYALAPDTIRRMMRRIFWRFQLLVTASFLAFGLYLLLTKRAINWSTAAPITGIIALVYFFIIFFNFRQQLRLSYSLRYEIDGSSVIFRQLGQDPARISRANITSVQARKDGLFIESSDLTGGLLVPYGLSRDGDADFNSTLDAWVGVRPDQKRREPPSRQLTIFVAAASLLVLLFANTLYIILPVGAFILVYGVYTERRLVNVLEARPGTVRMYNAAFSFLIFVIAMKSCLIGMALVH